MFHLFADVYFDSIPRTTSCCQKYTPTPKMKIVLEEITVYFCLIMFA